MNRSYNSDELGMRPAINGLMLIMWPAFLGAVVGSGVLFSVVDPAELRVTDKYLDGSSPAAYTVGFLALWAVIAIACALTHYLGRSQTHRPS